MPVARPSRSSQPLVAAIFDVDGVLVASPHERAWQEALAELMATDWRCHASRSSYAPERFTTAVHQARVAGKPRLSGARAVLEYFGVPDAEQRAAEYAERMALTALLAGRLERGALVSITSRGRHGWLSTSR
jgi:beta-phosphoglucomutase-like phosphatase (HAD superfamily)